MARSEGLVTWISFGFARRAAPLRRTIIHLDGWLSVPAPGFHQRDERGGRQPRCEQKPDERTANGARGPRDQQPCR